MGLGLSRQTQHLSRGLDKERLSWQGPVRPGKGLSWPGKGSDTPWVKDALDSILFVYEVYRIPIQDADSPVHLGILHVPFPSSSLFLPQACPFLDLLTLQEVIPAL